MINFMASVSALYIYPVKSLGGISLNTVDLTDRGFRYDRRWLLVDENNQFLTQRQHTQMALLQAAIIDDGIEVHKRNTPSDSIKFPFVTENKQRENVTIWDDVCEGVEVSKEVSQWFTDALAMNCRLMFMPDDSHRKIDPRYALHNNDITSFSDAYPVMLIAKESLDDLNERLDEKLPMNRFRPNLVIEGLEPYEEDWIKHFSINGIDFFGVKLCSRCVLTTVNQQTGNKGKEPLKTLATYRSLNNNIYFGQNIIYKGTGTLTKGDKVKVIERKDKPSFRILSNN